MRLTGLWWWIDRWRKSTAYTDMTLEQQGAYRNLLDEAALRGGPIPNDERILAKASGDAVRWRKVRDVVMARFSLTEDGWRNATLDEVLTRSKDIADQRSAAGKAGNDSRWHRKRIANTVANGVAKPIAPDPDPDPSLRTQEQMHDRARATPLRIPIIPKNTHVSHEACDPTFSYCVPGPVARKLTDLLAPKYGGDRDAARGALVAWYPTVWAKLVPGFVMGDAFKFWQGRFDEFFASEDAPKRASARLTEDAAAMDAGVAEILRKQGVIQ